MRGPLALFALIATAGTASALVTIIGPRLTAYHAALLVDADSGRALYQYQADMPWPPASLTKMMLLLVAEERLKAGRISLDMAVRISRKAAATGGKRLNLRAGAVYPLGELMRAALVASANDAAVAVAEAIAGSTETCVRLMNEEAWKMGLLHTHYATVDGLPSPPGESRDVTNAHDLATLARYIIYHTDLLDWSRVELSRVDHGALVVRNTNELLAEFPGCDGLKTGYTYESGFSLAATAHRHGLRLIVVILGSGRSSERFRQAARLLQWGFDNYETTRSWHRNALTGRENRLFGDSTREIGTRSGRCEQRTLCGRDKRAVSRHAVATTADCREATQVPEHIGLLPWCRVS